MVDIPSDDPDLDEEEDLFNTDFVTAVTSGDLKVNPYFNFTPFTVSMITVRSF